PLDPFGVVLAHRQTLEGGDGIDHPRLTDRVTARARPGSPLPRRPLLLQLAERFERTVRHRGPRGFSIALACRFLPQAAPPPTPSASRQSSYLRRLIGSQFRSCVADRSPQ